MSEENRRASPTPEGQGGGEDAREAAKLLVSVAEIYAEYTTVFHQAPSDKNRRKMDVAWQAYIDQAVVAGEQIARALLSSPRVEEGLDKTDDRLAPVPSPDGGMMIMGPDGTYWPFPLDGWAQQRWAAWCQRARRAGPRAEENRLWGALTRLVAAIDADCEATYALGNRPELAEARAALSPPAKDTSHG